MVLPIIRCGNCTCSHNGILISLHRHDFVTCPKGFFIDGGFDYTRYSGTVEYVPVAEVLSILRERLSWTSVLNANGEMLNTPVTKKLKDLGTDHIRAIIDNNYGSEQIRIILMEELKFRENEQVHSSQT